jgi:hypothetical protein
MSIINNAKEIADLIKKVGDAELYRKIVELEGEIVDLTREKREAETEVERLREGLYTKGKMTFKRRFYFMEDDPIPYCPKCWEVDRIAVHLDGPDINFGYYTCHSCEETFNPLK